MLHSTHAALYFLQNQQGQHDQPPNPPEHVQGGGNPNPPEQVQGEGNPNPPEHVQEGEPIQKNNIEQPAANQ